MLQVIWKIENIQFEGVNNYNLSIPTKSDGLAAETTLTRDFQLIHVKPPSGDLLHMENSPFMDDKKAKLCNHV